MRGIIYDHYGEPNEVLALRDVPKFSGTWYGRSVDPCHQLLRSPR